jgi:hypothetical protein
MTAIPAARAIAGLCSVTSSEFTSSVPASGWYTPARIFTSVDLPAPFSPTRACASPPYSSIEPSTRACTAPKDFAACSSTRTGLDSAEPGASASAALAKPGASAALLASWLPWPLGTPGDSFSTLGPTVRSHGEWNVSIRFVV